MNFQIQRKRLGLQGKKMLELYPRFLEKSANPKQSKFIFGDSRPDFILKSYKNAAF